MSCCKQIVFNIVDFSMIYKQQKRHVLEDFEVKKYEYQALAWFLRDYEFPLGKCCTILEEAHDQTVTQEN